MMSLRQLGTRTECVQSGGKEGQKNRGKGQGKWQRAKKAIFLVSKKEHRKLQLI